jgi:hypothetical protein
VPPSAEPAKPTEPTEPADAPAAPQPKTEIAAESAKTKAAVAVARPASERTERQARPHARLGAHDKVAGSLPAVEAVDSLAVAKPKGHKHAGADPFDSYGDGESPTVAPAPPAPAANAGAEPSAPPKSRRSAVLDDLMANGGSESKSHDKRSTSREIDAMLKDVQKSAPPAPKRAEPPALPSLTASDIAKAMAGVKSHAATCGQRFGQNGIADLKLTVGSSGRVSDVAVRGKLADSATGRCVAEAARGAVFPRSGGLTFDYRIDVR